MFSLSEDLVGIDKMDTEPPQRTGIIVAFNDMNEFEKYASLSPIFISYSVLVYKDK